MENIGNEEQYNSENSEQDWQDAMAEVESFEDRENQKAAVMDVYELRDKYGKNPDYPHIFWQQEGERTGLHVTIGDTKEFLPVNDALQKYGNNRFFQAEYQNLLKVNRELQKEVAVISGYNASEEKVLRQPVYGDQSPVTPMHPEMRATLDSIMERANRKLDQIVDQLELHESEEPLTQLDMCCRVQEYIVRNNRYDPEHMAKKESLSSIPEAMQVYDLASAILENEGVCTSNSAEMRELLTRVGIKAECVGVTDKQSGEQHMSVLVELMDNHYYFDPTLERAIWEDQGKPDDIKLCCAGLGQSEYQAFYTPQVIVPKDFRQGIQELPNNIAESRIPPYIVNDYANKIK